MGFVRKLFRLTAEDRWLLLQTTMLLHGVRLGLWLFPFQRLRNILAKLSFEGSQNKFRIPLNKIIWSVEASSRYTPKQAKCLAKALTAQVLFNRWGYSNQLYIGIAKNGQGQLAAHAWIEHQNKVLIGNLPGLSDFTPLPSLKSIGL
ncbi:MAG: lasso peptide biosynthesis B2 protein [Cyanobacteria bacterium P01_D01_bin.156]